MQKLKFKSYFQPNTYGVSITAMSEDYGTLGSNSTDKWNSDEDLFIPLKPTKYESITYIDVGDDEESWDMIFKSLGFTVSPSRYIIQSFEMDKITIDVIKVRNEVNEPFLKLTGNTTRKVLDCLGRLLTQIKNEYERI